MPESTFLDSTELVLNMGPQHPSTHGVLRVILKLDGEKVLGTECIIGYLHRGVEKIAENRTYAQFNPYVDRMDYVAAVSNGLGYCLAVEKLLNVEAPPRAQAVRVILTELNRIASHLLWLARTRSISARSRRCSTASASARKRSRFSKKYCGARLTTHAFRIGGLLYETYDGFEQEIRDFCEMFLPRVDEYEELLTNNRIWVGRLKDVGLLNADECKEYGVTGPVLRAAGVKWDLRKAQALLRLREVRLRHSDPHQRRHLRPLHRADGGDAAIGAHHASGGRADSRRPDHGQGRQGDQAAGG